jgi:hypothetical protein
MFIQQSDTSNSLKLYLVEALDLQGDPLDSLIWGTDPSDAVRDWSEAWAIEEEAYDLAEITNPHCLPRAERQSIVDQAVAELFTIGPRYREIDPATATAGVIDWPDWVPAQIVIG